MTLENIYRGAAHEFPESRQYAFMALSANQNHQKFEYSVLVWK
jgi:hypothetical protein